MTEEEKLKIVEFKDDDSPEIRGMKSYWQMVLAMPKPERKVFFQEERVKTEERELQWMIDSIKKDDEFIANATANARKLMQDIRDFGHEDGWLERAELWTEIAQSTKANKYTIKDIRKQRERIWQEKRKLKTMQPSDEQSQSSSNSRT